MAASPQEPSLGELFTSLAKETGSLVRQEVQLAKTEITGKAISAGRNLGLIGAGGALAHAGLLALVVGLIIGLGALIPYWLSALVIGIVVTGVGYAFVQKGLRGFRQIDPVPQRTLATLHDDEKWVKEQVP